MPSSTTTNYQLNQWSADDQVRRVDFNADNAKIDAAIKAVDQRADTLSAGKADQIALDAETSVREAAVSTLTAQLATKGNCKVVTGSYTGNGNKGSSSPNSLSFSNPPMLVVVGGSIGGIGIFVKGCPVGFMVQDGSSQSLRVSWSGNGLSWYNERSGTAYYQLNESGSYYNYTALLSL